MPGRKRMGWEFSPVSGLLFFCIFHYKSIYNSLFYTLLPNEMKSLGCYAYVLMKCL